MCEELDISKEAGGPKQDELKRPPVGKFGVGRIEGVYPGGVQRILG